MTLPKRPERSQPIPNEPFDSPEVTTIKGPYWDMALGSGLEADGQGSVQTAGSEPSEPSAMLYGSNGFVGVGTGLQVGGNGELEQGGGYIYCTPQFSHLPVTYPPYGCETEVNTEGVTDFYHAWYGCDTITEFPCVDSSSVTRFGSSWQYCSSLDSFPLIDTSSGTYFNNTWAGCSGLTSFPKINISSGYWFYAAWCACDSLTSFPNLDFSSATYFTSTWLQCPNLEFFPVIDTSNGEEFNFTWQECTSLISFPTLNFSSATQFDRTWYNCTSLTTLPAGMFDSCLATSFFGAWQNCALSQTSVDNILVSLDIAGQSNGTVNIDGGTSAAPSAIGLAAKLSLQGKGWTVTTN